MNMPPQSRSGSDFPMELPKCPEHGTMELKQPGTREQAFCGTWYRCTRCTNSVLFRSPELEAQLAAKRQLGIETEKRQ